uniref:FGFR1 oncogene partner (FOP) N-terminal dimerisation domain-containing protein n=1 Tax=Mucochytrium quahogii TaxID=96639 RepID=A0A7S2S6D2_9STRA|mmetsp:Transcript_11771/g.19195  ORF Transcript_11771/g.19195 Transcript_11771/m.19195 type:complete len:135 (+) Transcript_11771:141-545(+)
MFFLVFGLTDCVILNSTAVADAFQANGVQDKVKAKLRAEVFKLLEGNETVVAPAPTNENLIINELIREYLRFNQYSHTLSVFVPESGQPKQPAIPRTILADDLNIREPIDLDNDRPVPLLYSVVQKLLDSTGRP